VLALSSQISVAKNYEIGTVFNDIVEFDFPATKVKVPLPPGDWKLLSIHTYRTSPSNIELLTHYLIRHTKNFVAGLISIRVPTETVFNRFAIGNRCSEKKKRISWYIHDDSWDGHEDCSVMYPFRGWNRNYKPLQPTVQYVGDNDLTVPNAWVMASFTRTEDSDYLRIEYALPQEYYGMPREEKHSNNNSPWHINNISGHPKKKAFMMKAREWMESWKGLVDSGFKNKLNKDSLRAHPRIDGHGN